MKEIKFLLDTSVYNSPAGVKVFEARENSIWEVLQEEPHGWLRIRIGWVNSYWPSVQIFEKGPEVKPQAPYQADDATVQLPAVDSVGYLETHFEKVGHQLYRRCEPDEECIIEVYILNVNRCVVRYQRLLGGIIWSEYITAATLKSYLKALFAQEGLGSL